MGWQEVQYGALNLLEIIIKQENLLKLNKKLVPNSMNYHTNKNRTLMIHYKQLEIRNSTSICNNVNLQGSLQCHIEEPVGSMNSSTNKKQIEMLKHYKELMNHD